MRFQAVVQLLRDSLAGQQKIRRPLLCSHVQCRCYHWFWAFDKFIPTRFFNFKTSSHSITPLSWPLVILQGSPALKTPKVPLNKKSVFMPDCLPPNHGTSASLFLATASSCKEPQAAWKSCWNCWKEHAWYESDMSKCGFFKLLSKSMHLVFSCLIAWFPATMWSRLICCDWWSWCFWWFWWFFAVVAAEDQSSQQS